MIDQWEIDALEYNIILPSGCYEAEVEAYNYWTGCYSNLVSFTIYEDYDNDGIITESDNTIGKLLQVNGSSYKKLGDVNNDGQTNLMDLIRLKKITSKTANDGNSDLDGNGNNNSNDIAFLQKFMLVFDSRLLTE